MKKKMSFVMAGMMAVSSMSLGSVATFAEEPYTVKIVCVGDATTEACEEVSKAVSEITMEKYGVNVELVRLSYGSFQQEVNLMLASGEKLDLFPNFSFTTMSASATGQIIWSGYPRCCSRGGLGCRDLRWTDLCGSERKGTC